MPIAVLLAIFFQAMSDYRLDYKGYPLWAILSFGIGVVVIPIVIAFLLPEKILDRR